MNSSFHSAISKVSISLVFLLFTSVSMAQCFKVVVMLGQSNMVGTGRVCDINSMLTDNPDFDIPPYFIWGDVHGRTDLGTWQALNQPSMVNSDNIVQLDAGYGAIPSLVGCEIGLGHQLNRLRPETEFAFIKIALGGSSLAADWVAPLESHLDSGGFLFNRFRDDFDIAIEQAHAALPEATFEIVGVLWMQGEADATNPTHATEYGQNLINFATKTRDIIHNSGKTYVINTPETPAVPFIMGLISDQEALDTACTSPIEPFNVEACPLPFPVNSPEYYTNKADTFGLAAFYMPFESLVRNSQMAACNIEGARCSYFETSHYQRGCGYDNEIHFHANGLTQMGIDFANSLVQYLPTDSCSTLVGNTMAKVNNKVEIIVYPNPAQEMLIINLATNPNQQTIVRLINIANQPVKELVIEKTLGRNDHQINLQGIPNGIYTIQIFKDGIVSYNSRVIKL